MPEYGTFIWNELVTEDQTVCGEFYARLFGWDRNEVDAGPLGTYTIFQSGGKDVAGMMNPTARDYGASPPPHWVGYIAVDNADSIAAAVPRLGGRILEPPHDIEGVGRICMFKDPSGALVHVMQPAEEQGLR